MSAAIQIEAVVTDHHQFGGWHLPAPGQHQQTAGVWFGWCFIAANDVIQGKASIQSDAGQRQLCQRAGVAGEDAEPATARRQLAHQLKRACRRLCGQRQLLLMRQQPGVLGGRFTGRQGGQVMQDVVLRGDPQLTANQRKIVDGQSQRAIQIEHPMARIG